MAWFSWHDRDLFQPTHPHGVRHNRFARVLLIWTFQPTHPHGVRLIFYPGLLLKLGVSTHAPARGATQKTSYYHLLTSFQPTHPHGVRQVAGQQGRCPSMFQPTHPHGVRPTKPTRMPSAHGFNPRTRTGCDGSIPDTVTTTLVSTHAPARGATVDSEKFYWYDEVSTHAPARGATKNRTTYVSNRPSFNPRTRTGCDPAPFPLLPFLPCFNPRTRTGCDLRGIQLSKVHSRFNPRTRTGCDVFIFSAPLFYFRFNPRTRTGCDVTTSPKLLPVILFQPTHPHGVRLALHNPVDEPLRFNPRTRTGCDPENCGLRHPVLVSTHAPARGATGILDLEWIQDFVFQPTHPHGVRRLPAGRIFYFTIVSTHAPARGATSRTVRHLLEPALFQPTHPHGVRRIS